MNPEGQIVEPVLHDLLDTEPCRTCPTLDLGRPPCASHLRRRTIPLPHLPWRVSSRAGELQVDLADLLIKPQLLGEEGHSSIGCEQFATSTVNSIESPYRSGSAGEGIEVLLCPPPTCSDEKQGHARAARNFGPGIVHRGWQFQPFLWPGPIPRLFGNDGIRLEGPRHLVGGGGWFFRIDEFGNEDLCIKHGFQVPVPSRPLDSMVRWSSAAPARISKEEDVTSEFGLDRPQSIDEILLAPRHWLTKGAQALLERRNREILKPILHRRRHDLTSE